MTTSVKREKALSPSGRPRRKTTTKITLLTPTVPIERVQKDAAKLKLEHPTLDDETVALCIQHISTRLSVRQIAKNLGASYAWCYARIARPDVQPFLQQLANSSLGLAAARSVQVLEDLASDSMDENMRYKASVELLDRAGLGNSTSHRDAGATQSYAFSFSPPVAPAKGE